MYEYLDTQKSASLRGGRIKWNKGNSLSSLSNFIIHVSYWPLQISIYCHHKFQSMQVEDQLYIVSTHSSKNQQTMRGNSYIMGCLLFNMIFDLDITFQKILKKNLNNHLAKNNRNSKAIYTNNGYVQARQCKQLTWPSFKLYLTDWVKLAVSWVNNVRHLRYCRLFIVWDDFCCWHNHSLNIQKQIRIMV